MAPPIALSTAPVAPPGLVTPSKRFTTSMSARCFRISPTTSSVFMPSFPSPGPDTEPYLRARRVVKESLCRPPSCIMIGWYQFFPPEAPIEMSRPLYTSTDLHSYPDFKEYAPEAFEAYNAWSAAAFAEGALGKKTKELIAFAVSHAIQCPYCIDVHAKGASSAGASLEEMTEAIHVAAVTPRGASLVHAVQAPHTLQAESQA